MLKKVTLNNSSSSTISNYREILESIGYSIPPGDKVRTSAVYRAGKSNNSLLIDFTQNSFYDFPERVGGPLSKLVYLTTGKSVDQLNIKADYTEKTIKVEEPITSKLPKYYSDDCLQKLLPDYSYFINERKISKETLKTFEAGLATKAKMYNRMVFVIRDPQNDRIIGFTGRVNQKVDKNYEFPKWLHSGNTRDFIYNYRTAFPAIRDTKKVILCESVGDVLALHESGIKNSLCLFGLNLSPKVLKYLLILNPDKIIVSTNQDENKRGNLAAEKIRKELLNHFQSSKVSINLPPESNDWNDELINNGKSFIQNWYKNLEAPKETCLQIKQNNIYYREEENFDYYQ